jgi:hypothetical protein
MPSCESESRICLFSLRNLERHVSRCAEYEFEDLIAEMDDADLVAPEASAGYALTQRLANRAAKHARITYFHPRTKIPRPAHDYDVFVAMCQQPRDLLTLNAAGQWWKRCRTSVCWLIELWACDCAECSSLLKDVLARFDHIFLMFNNSIGPVSKMIGKSCRYLPPGIDAVTFCPYPDAPQRVIDVFSLGRRSEVTHEALLNLSRQRKIFYVYDTIVDMNARCPGEHRHLVASMARRSRYFIVNAPKINKQWESNGQNEISYRFIEGAAAGTVMIGDPGIEPERLEATLGPDAMLHMPYDTPDVERLLKDWDSQPQRLAQIRRNGVIQSLLHHDWAYRWQEILNAVGLEPRPALAERIQRLQTLAHHVERA